MRSLSFPSVSCIPVLALKSWTTHKQPQAEKRQSLLSLAKGPGKGAAKKDRKLLDSMHSVAAKHPRKRCDPTHPLTTKAQRDPRGPPSPGCNKAPFPPAGDVTGSSVESQGFSHHGSKEVTIMVLAQVGNSNGTFLFLPARKGSSETFGRSLNSHICPTISPLVLTEAKRKIRTLLSIGSNEKASFSLQWSHIAAAAAAKSLQSCPTLCNPRDGSPPGSPVPGILQARTLEWVAISFSSA